MKVARLIIYEGSATALQKQLGNSMPDGTKAYTQKGGCSITIITLGISDSLERFVEAESEARRKQNDRKRSEGEVVSDGKGSFY